MGSVDVAHLSLNAKKFFSGTLLSRFSGMVRDLSMAFAFGDHPSVAAFMVAFRLSNLLRRLLGEGPFQSAFIPHFEGLRVENPLRARSFFRELTLLAIVLLLIVTCIGEVGLWVCSTYGGLSSDNLEILHLVAWMLPGLLFICLYGLNISLLHCHDVFFIPSFAPFICNMIWIIGALSLRFQPTPLAMEGLAQLVTVGFLGQWLLTLPATLKYVPLQLKEAFSFHIPPEVKQLAKLFAFGALGVGAVQVNGVVDAFFARCADLRGPIYLWYALRFEQLALAVFGIACVSTVVPRLSRALKANALDEARKYFAFSYGRIVTVMIPCTFAIIALGGSALNIIYGRGSFSEIAVCQTTLCLWSYALGLVPTTMVILFSALFYARYDFMTPLRGSLLTIFFNIVLNILFVFGFHLGAISTALATSLSSWFNFWYLHRKAQGWRVDFSIRKIGALIGSGLVGALCVVVIEHLVLTPTILPLLWDRHAVFVREGMRQMWALGAGSVAFIGSMIFYTKIFKNEDLLELCHSFLPSKKSRT